MTSVPYTGVPAGELSGEVIREPERVWRVPTGLASLTAVSLRYTLPLKLATG